MAARSDFGFMFGLAFLFKLLILLVPQEDSNPGLKQ
jgi:hypothetical protein